MFLRSLSVKAYEVLKLLMANGELAQFIPFAFVGRLVLYHRLLEVILVQPVVDPALFSFRTFVKLMLLRIWYS